MRIVIIIEDEADGRVALTLAGEQTRPSRAKRVRDLIVPALEAEFRPVRKKRETISFEEVG